MGKRKTEDDAHAQALNAQGESSDEDVEIIMTDFEFFDPQPAIDFHGLKTLCRELFDSDAQLFDLSALVDLILSQPTIGSTVKTDTNESDAWGLVTVLNLHEHREKQVIKDIIAYILSKATVPPLSSLAELLSPASSAQVGLLISSRFINVPAALSPAMYNMLLEETDWARKDGEPYAFTHYLILSRTYIEVDSLLDAEENPPSKKKKKQKGGDDETFYFHPEDEVLHKYAIGHANFQYIKQGDEGASDSKRAFQEVGIKPQGHMILIEGSKLPDAVKAMKSYLQTE